MNIITNTFSVLKKSSAVAVFTVAAFSSNLSAQKKIDTYFDHLFIQKKMMGSVAVSYKDSIIYAKAIGYADADSKLLNNNNTKFRIASLTKTFTGALILKAVEEKKLTLGDKLSAYYPEVKNADKITIKHLLNQRSGIINFTEIEGENTWEKTLHSQKDFIDFFVNEKSNFEPGSKFEYSNTNYALLGFILEKLYQKPFAEILDEKICKPLHLKNTYYSFETDSKQNEALSYNIQDKFLRNAAVNFSNHPASGGISSTPSDVNKFLFALFNNKLISAESLKMMLPKTTEEYGMGIMKLALGKNEVYEHGGRVENYYSDYWYFPKENLGIVVLTNAVNIDLEQILITLTEFAYNNEPELPDFNKIEELSDKEFAAIRGTYFTKDKKESVTISSNGNSLIFQGSESGQDYIPLKFTTKNTFEYQGIKVVFDPQKHQFQIFQDNKIEVYTQNI
ncbi:beta-lactamase family protein [Chryseobacterium aahli]|uniref:serine hydrolase domain-containing protein n=1 Tax=Chryseobacterium aahli TaxID=1278643 RepID=UPI001F622275|nr:serine hydrolase domain-containing protein [Chryseobacterium aahli]MCI3939111.1 beta-lactamase family protein [Chryseobacterium aahli]